LLAANGAALAQTTSTNAPPPAAAHKARAKAITGIVDKVDNDAKTLTLKDHDKPFVINSKTKITKDGEPATLSDIVAGDRASIRAKDEETGNPVATSIRILKPKKGATADAAPAPAPEAK
jgi:hypothetical protein